MGVETHGPANATSATAGSLERPHPRYASATSPDVAGRRVERLRAERVRVFVQELLATLSDGTAKPAYIFTERRVDYRMPRPGEA